MPVSRVHAPSVGAAADVTEKFTAGLATSALTPANAHRLALCWYSRMKPDAVVPACAATTWSPVVFVILAQADTLKLCEVSSTGPAVLAY